MLLAKGKSLWKYYSNKNRYVFTTKLGLKFQEKYGFTEQYYWFEMKDIVVFTTSYISKENYTQILEYVKALMKPPS